MKRGIPTILAVVLGHAALPAQVERARVTERADLLDGRSFGEAGAYEKLTGSLEFALDPAAPGNRQVVDLALAPRDARGLVHASADFCVLQPKDGTKRSGIGLFEVSNRGGKGMLSRFCFARGSSDPSSAEDFGDGMLLEQGLTLIWVGWQCDVPDRAGLLRLRAPVARDSGDAAISGLVRADWTVERDSPRVELGHRGHIPYRVAAPEHPSNQLTARSGPDAPRKVLARQSWRFVDDGLQIELDGGFHAGTVYELVYVGADPAVVGIGLAAVRDAIAFAKHDESCPFPIREAVAVGISQSGRFLRHFLWLDFNTDLSDRIVFDGVMVLVAGAGRGSFDHRFAQPSRDGHRLAAFLFPTDLFPFTSRTQDDPLTGTRDALVEGRTSHAPKLFQINGGYEYWGRAAALIHTSVDGTRDVDPLPDERIYAISSSQHFDVPLPKSAGGDLPSAGSPIDSAVIQRALLVGLLRWVHDGETPPASRVPRLTDQTLVPLAEFAFPDVPNLAPPKVAQRAFRVDYGPRFPQGIIDREPPGRGAAFPTLVPAVDRFGNDRGGIIPLELRVPLATYTPWHIQALFPGEPEPFYGSFLRLPWTEAERDTHHDARPSVQSLYRDRAEFAERVEAAARAMVDERVLLSRDVERVTTRALACWDLLVR